MTGMFLALLGGKVQIVTDQFFEYTTLLLPGNGTNGAQNNTFLDASTNNFTITRNGNTTQGTFSPFSQTGWGNYFDGNGDYLTAASNAAFTLDSTGDFTVECWIYPTAAFPSSPTAPAYILASQSDYNTGYLNRWGLVGAGSTIAWFNSAGSYGIQTSSLSLLNTWTHIAVVRSSSTITMYINGTSVGTQTLSQAYTTQSGAYVGFIPSASAFTGYISNARIVKGTAVYTSNFTPPTTPLTAISGTSLLTCQSNRFRDASSNNFTITVNGNTSVQAFSPFNPTSSWSATTNGGSGYFDGSGDYLSGTGSAATQMGTGAFTWECWCYILGTSSYQGFIDTRTSPSAGSATGMGLFLNTGTLTPIATTTGTILTSSINVTANAWNHVALTRTSGGTVTIWVNGQSGGTVSNSANLTDTSLWVGGNSSSPYPAYVNGYLSNVRMTKGADLYTTAFTPPTSPLTTTVSSGTVGLLLNFTNAGVYDATSKNDLETVGNAQISTAISAKWGSGCMAFDGNGDWLKGNQATTDLYTFSGDFTIETWVYSTSSASVNLAYPTIFGSSAYNSSGIGLKIQSSGGAGTTGCACVWYNNTQILTGTSNIADSVWHHVAVTRSGSTIRLFVDGTQQTSATNSSTFTCASGYPLVAADASSAGTLTGYLQDLRITKGYARYTANFTPPTSAFPTL